MFGIENAVDLSDNVVKKRTVQLWSLTLIIILRELVIDEKGNIIEGDSCIVRLSESEEIATTKTL